MCSSDLIYSRLMLARNLLSDDGVIFISIDDNEQGDLIKLCDEVFGASNFVENLIWKKMYGGKLTASGLLDTTIIFLFMQKIRTVGIQTCCQGAKKQKQGIRILTMTQEDRGKQQTLQVSAVRQQRILLPLRPEIFSIRRLENIG